MRLSFAKEKRETGLAGVARPTPDTRIKLDGRWVGTIHAPSYRVSGPDGWVVSVMVVTADGFRWVRFKSRQTTEPEARDWLRQNLPQIQEKYELRLAPIEDS